MNADIAVLAIVVLLTMLFVLRKTHVALTTLALCAGYLLADRLALPLARGVGDYFDGSDDPILLIVRVLLLFGPPVYIAIHFRDTQHGSGRFLEQLVPAFALSLLICIFILEIMTLEERSKYLDNSIALNQMWLFSAWVIVFALAASFFDLMTHKPERRHRHHRKKRKR